MAIEDLTPFGTAPKFYQGLLGEEETAALQKKAQIQGLLGAGLALAQGMSRSGAPRSALQNIFGAVAGGFQSAGNTYQGGLQNFQTQQQIQQVQLQREQLKLQRDQAVIQAQQQQAKNIVIKKMQMGEPLTQSDYAILNPEEYAKTQQAANLAARARGIPTEQQQPPQQAPQQPIFYAENQTAPVVSTTTAAAPTAPEVQNYPIYGDQGDYPQNAIDTQKTITTQKAPEKTSQPVPVVARPDYSQKIQEADRASQFYVGLGTKEGDDRAKSAREEADYLRKLQRQDQAVESSVVGLKNVHPTLLPRVKALQERSASNVLTADQVVAESNSILRDDSQIREKLSQDLFNKQLALAEAQSGVTYETKQQRFERASGLRKEFQNIQVVKDFDQVKVAYNQISGALKNPSPANDLAAATKFMKLLDPGSVVRESELGLAMAASPAYERVTTYYEKLKTGEKLTSSQREDFRKSAEMLYKASENVVIPKQNEYRDLAAEAGVNPNSVVVSAPTSPAVSETPRVPSGVVVRKIRN
jgi:hypothetical protein